MTTIYEKEISSFFHSMIGYLYVAFVLLITGILFTVFNLRGGLAEFGYVLGDTTWVLLIVIPLLTMRSISEEQKLKTDQLLLTSPIRMSSIVLGKFFAILTVFALPLLVLLTCPLVLSLYGKVSLPLDYTCFVAYFFMGAACIAIGIFLSSLTESQILAAVGTFAVLILCYLSSNLANLIGASAMASAICFAVLSLLLGLFTAILLRSAWIGGAAAAVGILACALLLLLDGSVLEGAFGSFLRCFSLFSMYYDFVDGVFDLTHLVFYASVTVLFLFFSVQSLEKRRWA